MMARVPSGSARLSYPCTFLFADVEVTAQVSEQTVSEMAVILEAIGAEDLLASTGGDVLPKQEEIRLADVVSVVDEATAQVSQQIVPEVAVALDAAGAEDQAPSEGDILPEQEDIQLPDIVSVDVEAMA